MAQRLLLLMMCSLEDKLDLVCWLDVVGGMGAGQDHRKEMQEGISKCSEFPVPDAKANPCPCVSPD